MTRLCLLALLALLSPAAHAQAPPEIWLQTGEILEIQAEGERGRPAVLHLPGGGTLKLEETSPGVFRGAVAARFPDGALTMVQGSQRKILGQAKILDTPALPVVEITRDDAVYRSGPDAAYDRHDPLPKGYRSLVSGRRGDWVRLEPAGGWVELSQARLVERAPSHPVLRYGRIDEPGDGSATVTLRLGDPAPWQVIEEEDRLVLWLPAAKEAMGEVMYPETPRRIRALRLDPTREGVRVALDLGEEGNWGYQLDWRAPDLVLRLAPPPRPGWRNPPVARTTDVPNPLQGLTLAVDPGHGGDDRGAIGRDGLHEADSNLAVSLALKRQLEARGARVVLTRSEDVALTPADAPADDELGARVRIAERAGAQLFLSIHHNARPTVEEARVAHGTHMYYFRPQSRELAIALAAPQAAAIGEPDHAALWRSFHVIRQTGMPSVLVEVNFISNPALEAQMRDPGYPDRVAAGLVQGLEDFLRAAAGGIRKDG